MKRLLLLVFICIIINVPFTINASSHNFTSHIQTEIKSLGVDLNNADFKELEPKSFYNYEDYMSNLNKNNKKDKISFWNSACHLNLNEQNVKIQSSSTLNGYPVSNLFDRQKDKAWVEGDIRNGIGEWVTIKLTPIVDSRECDVYINYFGIVSGYLKSDKTWDENNRVKSLLFIYKGYRGSNIGYKYYILRLKLKDFKGIQFFDISCINNVVTTNRNQIWIMIEDVYKGTKYDDTCISELVFNGNLPDYFLGP